MEIKNTPLSEARFIHSAYLKQFEDRKVKIEFEGKEIECAALDTPQRFILQNDRLNNSLVAKLNGKYHDLSIPFLQDSGKLEFFDFNSEEGEYTFRHSSAHVLGYALEKLGGILGYGPPIENGFYYDCYMNAPLKAADLEKIQEICDQFVKVGPKFERLYVTKDVARQFFAKNKFKLETIAKIPGEHCTIYVCGDFVDLCRGPHLPSAKNIKLKILENSAAYWLGDQKREQLQRVYGTSFPTEQQLNKWLADKKMADELDHRKIGLEQKLFFFNEVSPGSCFFLPHGTRIYNKLMALIRAEYEKRGFQEVITPTMFNCDLWKQSGHYQNYKDNMFLFDVEEKEFGLKPMNCPGHCMIFNHEIRSYRDLPIRLADFGVLHRNEFSGALTGLTRVRRFQQDDAHIFCRQDQIEKEIDGCLDFLKHVYGIFAFEFELQLSTRPEKYLGELSVWEVAEQMLTQSLNRFGQKWKLNPGDGAFYGPKIDIKLKDKLGRKHQCATIQLDFQLPIRFGLEFKSENGFERPVIIHRAILGSVERFMAVLIEHTGGNWPFWLSPRQIMIIPIHQNLLAQSKEVAQKIKQAGFYCDLDDSKEQFNKKIRNAEVSHYNFIVVIGNKEVETGTISVRTKNEQLGSMTLDAFLAKCKSLLV